jgi:phosphoribosylpyrophosphate synthetase
MGVNNAVTRERRKVWADRFLVQDSDTTKVDGAHVLVVDDTWVSGGTAQSVAVALKDAGARAVTILCVARWLRWDWSSTPAFVEEYLTAPYEPLVCPVTGDECP